MNEERVEVVAYAGYREEESPRALTIDGKRVEVRKVLDRWTEEDRETGKRRRCFKVKGDDFRTRVVCCDEAGTWYCRS
ncbi:MAG TPA: hypothetical protein VI298_11860 [Geobacteraceae bacterium]